MKYVLLMGVFLFPILTFAQPTRLMVPFESASGDVYEYALTGGLTNPQFSEIDLDGDGDQDLVYFDRVGFAVVPFLNGGTPNTVDYTFAPEYAYRFPKVENWMLLRDYNCDNLEDLFAYKYDNTTGVVSITVYRASRDAQNKVQFSLVKNTIEYTLKGQNQGYNLFNSTVDLPAVDDIDGDGDMDILNFNSSGGYIEMFRNESQENGWGCDSLNYVYYDNCWGRMYESGITETIDLSPRIDSCAGYPNWNPVRSGRHAGSTILTLDMNNDGVKEIILGDLSFSNLNLLTNGGNKDTAHLTAQETFFPMNSISADVEIFPAAFYVDVNNDGAKDLIAAPNILGNSKNLENWYYKNTGTANFPVFTYEENHFLVDEMIDLGTGAAPVFWDYNGDGLMDIVVGNYNKYVSVANQGCYLSLYENVGSITQPAYRLVDDDLASMKQFNLRRLVPTFADLDGDNDKDMLLGDQDGLLIYVENQGTVSSPSFTSWVPNYANIDVGQNATPQLVDVNRDGKIDLLVGERNGNTNYFENTGTPTAPAFSSTATSETFGLIDAKLPGTIEGNSAPHLVDINGEYHLFMGNEAGEVWQYTNIDNNLQGAFTRINSVLDTIDEGEESIISVANINNDGQYEFLIGNKRGGLGLYTEYILSSIEAIEKNTNSFTIAPNPTSEQINIQFDQLLNEEVMIRVTNALGQVVLDQKEWLEQNTTLNLRSLPTGTYILSIETEKERYISKLVKQ
ncbi:MULTISPECIES: T9SS type A sorting domain-containing protein [unclassified Aureispira]|uniref:T9SS type A sorting domain-containing protein n=1 Tax=unclassified Aureispira TaxID=2649989 RepID=UPI0009DD2265|nr:MULTISPECIES: T9SS type A sorting domain-containing protein [unclassified Aureispira]WMX16780.1 T9SS type A sorting domain-containing protein [Aureispira sp. CCB-E]